MDREDLARLFKETVDKWIEVTEKRNAEDRERLILLKAISAILLEETNGK